jgi:hypothetical protein
MLKAEYIDTTPAGGNQHLFAYAYETVYIYPGLTTTFTKEFKANMFNRIKNNEPWLTDLKIIGPDGSTSVTYNGSPTGDLGQQPLAPPAPLAVPGA